MGSYKDAGMAVTAGMVHIGLRSEIDLWNKNLEELNICLSDLEERLAPLSIPTPGNVKVDHASDPAPAHSAIVNMMQDHNTQMADMIIRLRHATNSIEL